MSSIWVVSTGEPGRQVEFPTTGELGRSDGLVVIGPSAPIEDGLERGDGTAARSFARRQRQGEAEYYGRDDASAAHRRGGMVGTDCVCTDLLNGLTMLVVVFLVYISAKEWAHAFSSGNYQNVGIWTILLMFIVYAMLKRRRMRMRYGASSAVRERGDATEDRMEQQRGVSTDKRREFVYFKYDSRIHGPGARAFNPSASSPPFFGSAGSPQQHESKEEEEVEDVSASFASDLAATVGGGGGIANRSGSGKVGEGGGGTGMQGQNFMGGSECIICLCEYEEGEEICCLPCHHAFHKTCVMTWMDAHRVCPACRFDVTSDETPLPNRTGEVVLDLTPVSAAAQT